MVVTPPLIFVEWRLAPLGWFGWFGHCTLLRSKNIDLNYRKETACNASTTSSLLMVSAICWSAKTGYGWANRDSKILFFLHKSMKHFKESNVFIYVRRFAGRRKQI
jgi:hypothetical protein